MKSGSVLSFPFLICLNRLLKSNDHSDSYELHYCIGTRKALWRLETTILPVFQIGGNIIVFKDGISNLSEISEIVKSIQFYKTEYS